MNKDRRSRIAEIVSQLETLKDQIAELQGEEQDAFDNLPEGLQQSDRGQQSENAASYLSDAESSIDDVISSLNDAAE